MNAGLQHKEKTMTTTTKAKSDKRPTHVIYLVQGEDDPRWTKIAAAFAHKDGNGFNIVSDIKLPFGRIVMRAAKDQDEDQGALV